MPAPEHWPRKHRLTLKGEDSLCSGSQCLPPPATAASINAPILWTCLLKFLWLTGQFSEFPSSHGQGLCHWVTHCLFPSSLDASEALASLGVVDVLTARDVPGDNGREEESLYAQDEVV